MSPQPHALMVSVLALQEKINSAAQSCNGADVRVFDVSSIPVARLTPAELGVIRVASWLYVHYYEVGKIHVAFLVRQLDTYGLDAKRRHQSHYLVVQQLRTVLQHNLDQTKERNRQIKRAGEDWFQRKCGAVDPSTERQWEKCLTGLLGDAERFLARLLDCIRAIERDESRESIVKQWQFHVSRYHAPHEFDDLIAEVASDIGQDAINPVNVRTRYYEKWTEELRLLTGTYDFRLEARKRIEHALLYEVGRVLPITGDDIMREFALAPGPHVGALLKRARSLYDAHPCPRADLLARLHEERGTS